MEYLLEDVLLKVMQYLSVPDLLSCRLVCKRIGGLALHPHVWRRRYLSDRYHRYCVPVLRLAPCLARLDVVLRAETAENQLLYSTTRCAVSYLTLSVHEGSAVYAALVIRNQEVLGRLKEIVVEYRAYHKHGSDAPALLWAVAFTSGLEVLAADFTGPSVVMSTTSMPTARPRSSLRSFRCGLRPELGPLRDFVLAAHADTMEDVSFDYPCDFKALTSTASLLAGMPNLRRLYSCPLFPGIDALAACESLERVLLVVRPEMRDAVPQAKEFLRRAKQLRNVTIQYGNGASTDGVGVDLVLALVSSGPSLVESFTIIEFMFFLHEPRPQLQPVICALPLMPALQKLQLPMVSEDLLLAITPATNPVLRTIELHSADPDAILCAHEYLHCNSVGTLLSRNPSLDLIVFGSYYCSESHSDACEPCKLGCHREVWKREGREDPLDYDDLTDWIHIPRLNLNPVSSNSIALP